MGGGCKGWLDRRRPPCLAPAPTGTDISGFFRFIASQSIPTMRIPLRTSCARGPPMPPIAKPRDKPWRVHAHSNQVEMLLVNTIYKIVRSPSTGKWVVASELAKGSKKKRTSSGAMMAASILLGLSFGGNVAFAETNEAKTSGPACTTTDGKSGTIDDAGKCVASNIGRGEALPAPFRLGPLFRPGLLRLPLPIRLLWVFKPIP